MTVLVEKRKQKRLSVAPICKTPYPAHMHDPAEIVILRRGHMNMAVNGTTYAMESDMAMVIFPGMIHSYESVSEDADGLFVGFTPELMDEFYHTLLTQWPVVPLVKLSECPEETEEAVQKLEQYSARDNGHPLLQAYAHLLVACLLMKLELVPSEDLNKENLMYRATTYIQQHSAENLTLDSVAKALGVGRSHLSHLFSQKMDLHFRTFLNTIRVEKACKLLQDQSMSIKEVCFECGFESTRTFHRAFLEKQKMTPGEYRERMQKGWAVPVEETEAVTP